MMNRALRRPAGAETFRSIPDMTASIRMQSLTEDAIGPTESSVEESGNAPSSGTRDCVGLNPVRPHSAAGMRTEPPVSDPMAAHAIPSLTLIAAPEEEPPGIRRSCLLYGLAGVPR